MAQRTKAEGRKYWLNNLWPHNLSQCFSCRNYIADGKCKAFQDGIPDQILHNEFDHSLPYPADGGVRFDVFDKGESA